MSRVQVALTPAGSYRWSSYDLGLILTREKERKPRRAPYRHNLATDALEAPPVEVPWDSLRLVCLHDRVAFIVGGYDFGEGYHHERDTEEEPKKQLS